MGAERGAAETPAAPEVPHFLPFTRWCPPPPPPPALEVQMVLFSGCLQMAIFSSIHCCVQPEPEPDLQSGVCSADDPVQVCRGEMCRSLVQASLQGELMAVSVQLKVNPLCPTGLRGRPALLLPIASRGASPSGCRASQSETMKATFVVDKASRPKARLSWYHPEDTVPPPPPLPPPTSQPDLARACCPRSP